MVRHKRPDPPKDWFTPPEVAKMLSVSAETIRNRIRDERIEGVKIKDENGGAPRYYVHREEVEKCLNDPHRTNAITVEDAIQRYARRVVKDVLEGQKEVVKNVLEGQEKIIKDMLEPIQRDREIVREELSSITSLLDQVTKNQEEQVKAIHDMTELHRKALKEKLGKDIL